MTQLFNFFVYGYFFQNAIVLFQFDTLRSIFLVLGSDITGSAGHTTVLVLCAFQNYLYPVTFLSHCSAVKNLGLQMYGIKVKYQTKAVKSGAKV